MDLDCWKRLKVIVGLAVCLLVVMPLVSARTLRHASKSDVRSLSLAEGPLPTVNLREFGASGDGLADDGPALQGALNALADSGGGTLFVPAGEYLIVTPVVKNFSSAVSAITIQGEPSSTPIDVNGNGRGLDLTSEFIIKVGATNDALMLTGLQTLLLTDVSFIGVQNVLTDARTVINLVNVESATIQHCEFYGLASLVAGGAIVFAYRTSLSIEQTAFLGCAGNSGVYNSVVQNLSWKEISVVDTKFIDYGNRPDFYSKTPLAATLSWVSIGDPAALEASSSRRTAIIQNAFLDEGHYFGISALPYRYEPVLSAPFEVYLSRVNMNVNNLGSTGVYLSGAQIVFVERSHFGWSHNAAAAIGLFNVGEAVLDLLACVDHADTIFADAATQRLIVLNSTYRILNSAAPYTRALTTAAPMDDPVQYVRQQYLNVVAHEPDMVGHYYWSNLMLRCEGNSSCLNAARDALASYLATAPAERFSLSGTVRNESGAPMSAVTITLSGSQSVSIQTDATGSYSFTKLATAGNYTVTLSKRHYTFQSLVANTPAADQIANFTGVLNRYSISGRVVNQTGQGIAGATLTLSGSESRTTTTNASGNYSFSNVAAGGNYTVTVSRNNYVFGLSSRVFPDLSANQQSDFTGTLLNYSISGKASTADGGPISGATISLSGSQTRATTTDSSGNYSFTVPAEGNYAVAITRVNYAFAVSSHSFNNLSANQRSDFSGVLLTYTISGQITNLAGSIITVALSGSQNRTTQTNSSGQYSFSNVPAIGNYTITPARPCSDFAPANRTFDNLSAKQTSADFVDNDPLKVPLVLTEENSDHAIALDSVALQRDPFTLTDVIFGSAQRTRISIFFSNVQLRPCEDASVVAVQADAAQNVYQLPVEFVGGIANVSSVTQVVVKLPDNAPVGDLWLTIRVRGVASKRAYIKIE